MSTTAEKWFTEKIKDQVTTKAQLIGGYLDGTMLSGETEAGKIKFPLIDLRALVTKPISGAIQLVNPTGASLDTVEVSPIDYEATTWYRKQDLYKMGPAHESLLAEGITRAIRNRQDTIKWEAIKAFATANSLTAIGGAAVTIDPIYLEDGRGRISAAGMMEEGQCFMPLPARAMSQLAFWKEWNDADFVGTGNLPFSKLMREKTKTVRGVHYMELPDEFFGLTPDADADSFETYMWSYYSMGAETPWKEEAPSMTRQDLYEGSPWLIKAGIGGAAVGLQIEGLKKFTFDAPVRPTRPA